jgi:hypothetical protein
MKKLLFLSICYFISCNLFAQTPTLQQVTTAGATTNNTVSFESDIFFTGSYTGIHFRKSGNTRWYLRHDDAESGGNTGSNFSLYSYNDIGGNLRQNISINRATGLMTVDGDMSMLQVTARNLTFKEADYIGMLGRGASLTSGWTTSLLPDAYTLTYFKRDFAIGGWRKSDGQWNGPAFFINSDNGNVLIGKITQTNATYKLDVAGNVRANKVVVNTTGADFVFDSTYNLIPLPALGNYVKEHRHLPGIKPAAEMQQEGLDVGENQTKLLQKIEELTLYIIELNKKVTEQEKKINALEKRN